MNEIAKINLLSTAALLGVLGAGVGLYVNWFPSVALVPTVTVDPPLLVAGLGSAVGLLTFRRYLRWKSGTRR